MREPASAPDSPAGRRASGFRRAATLAVQFVLTGVVTWFVLRAVGLNLEELKGIDLSGWELRWGLLALASLLLLLAYLYSAALWGLMVKELGGPEIGILTSQRIFFTANLGRYVPGKLWQIAGLAYLAQREGVRPGTATAAAVLGQGFSLAGATLVGVGVLLGNRGGAALGGEWAVLVLVLLLGAMIFPMAFRGILRLWFRLAKREMPGGFRPDEAFGVRWIGLYGIGWILQGVAFWALARGLGLDLTLLAAVPTYPAAYLLGYLAFFAPAGLGMREATLVVFLQPILGAGAVALSVAARLWTTALELVLAGVLAGQYVRNRKRGEGAGV